VQPHDMARREVGERDLVATIAKQRALVDDRLEGRPGFLNSSQKGG